MAKISPETKVGIMTVIAVIILIVGTLLIGKFAGFGKTYIIKVYFDFVGGIEKGAPVRLGGVKVGIVKDINIVPTYKSSIELVLRISKTAMIHKNARVFISTMGLMGEKYVEIYAGTPETAFLVDGDSLTGQNPLQMEDILAASKQISEDLAKTIQAISEVITKEETKNSISNFIAQLDSITGKIDRLLSKKQGDLEQFTTNLRLVTDQMKIVVTDVDTIIKENRAEIKSTISDFSATADTVHKNIDRIVENLDKITGQVNTMIAQNQPELKATVQNFRSASEDFKKAMEKINELTGKVQSGEGTIGKLINESKLYDDTSQTLGSVKQAADAVKNVAGKTGDFFTNINFEYDLRYYDVLDRWRNDIDIRFNPSKGKYYLGGVSDIGRNSELDLLFAQSFGSWDVKLGVLESEAAMGIDFRTIDDRLKLGIKTVGVTEIKPRVDFDTEYHLADYWYLVLGAHDLTRDIQSNAGVKIRY
jgi:phospholipid/cholesterol/gamma-HCH transport system substrate-binding protein